MYDEITSEQHSQYLLDLAQVTEEWPGHNQLQLERVFAHLEHWGECSGCMQEAITESCPEAERRLNKFLAEKEHEEGGKRRFSRHALGGKALWKRRNDADREDAPLYAELQQKVDAFYEENDGNEVQDPCEDEPDDERLAQFEQVEFVEALEYVLNRLPWWRRLLVRLTLAGWTYYPKNG